MNSFSEEIKFEEKYNNLNMIPNIKNSNDNNNIFKDEKNIEKNDEKEHSNNNEFEKIFNKQQSIEISENDKKEIAENQKNLSNNKNNNNFTEEEEENNNIINNNSIKDVNNEMQNINKNQKDDNNNNNNDNFNENDNENDNDNNNDDEELPLITLNFISICQCCKTSFDNNTYLPYLLKCGHFFCIKCINEYFTDKNGIKCPSDGLIAKSTSELTLLNNLIPKNIPTITNTNNNDITSSELNTINVDNNNNSNINSNNINLINSSNYCPIHKGQKLSHVICESNEIICVYCAFECFKKNPKCEIKELSSQLNDFSVNINEIINNNQNEVLYLHDSLNKIKTNKETEEKAVNTFFDCVFDYLNEKKNGYLEQINNLFNNNAKKLGDELEQVTENIENSEKLKKNIEIFLEKGGIDESNFKDNYNEILNEYLMLKQKNKINKQKMELDEYKFIHIDEDRIVKNYHNLGEIKLLNKKNNLNLNCNLISNIKDNITNNKLFVEENNNISLEKGKEKNIFYNDNTNSINPINLAEDKLNQNINKTEIKTSYKKGNNYIILDDISITNNNISYVNADNNKNSNNNINNNILKFDIKNENDNSNYYIKGNIENKKKFILFNKNNNGNNVIRKNVSNAKSTQKEKKNTIHKYAKSSYNYIEFPNYNTPLNNYYLLSKLNNNKKDKERNITVNNYEVHQTLKNSYNNNYNYGHNFNNSNYLNKLFEINNTNYYGSNSNTHNNSNSNLTNRNKFSFLSGLYTANKNSNKKFDFK